MSAATKAPSHRSRASASATPADYPHLSPHDLDSTVASPKLRILSGTGSPCGEGNWIALSGREVLLDEEYSEVEYSDMEGEDDMIFDSPPYYHYDDRDMIPDPLLAQQQHALHHPTRHHQQQPPPPQQQHQQQQQQAHAAVSSPPVYQQQPNRSRRRRIAPVDRHLLTEQEQEDALRASLSTLLATTPRPKFTQRQRPKKLYSLDPRSQRSSPLVPASPTHVYYSSTTSPHLLPVVSGSGGNGSSTGNSSRLLLSESPYGDISPVYFSGSYTPLSWEYESGSSDSEMARSSTTVLYGTSGGTSGVSSAGGGSRRGLFSAGDYGGRDFYEIESTTLNSAVAEHHHFFYPPSGSTTPLHSPSEGGSGSQLRLSVSGFSSGSGKSSHHSTAPLSPLEPNPVDVCATTASTAERVLSGPSSILAGRFVSWSTKAQSILDHASKVPLPASSSSESGGSESNSALSSPDYTPPRSPCPSPNLSPVSSGASTPTRAHYYGHSHHGPAPSPPTTGTAAAAAVGGGQPTRHRKRPPSYHGHHHHHSNNHPVIPEPHQFFFSRALDQRALASHVSIARIGMVGALCSPSHVGLRAGGAAGQMLRGSSPLRPAHTFPAPSPFVGGIVRNAGGAGGGGITPTAATSTVTSGGPTPVSSPTLGSTSDGGNRAGGSGIAEADDKENWRWLGPDLGLNLWQATLGAAVRLGTRSVVTKASLASHQAKETAKAGSSSGSVTPRRRPGPIAEHSPNRPHHSPSTSMTSSTELSR
ncbi:hypothetical protein BGZ73_006637 [Actinomortierella ambigua]|nr:hypothetical protein BGZ73_006637 [Actinomortierella ambigua]